MPHTRMEFWQTKADFKLLNPEHRTGGYLRIVVAICSVSAAGVAIYKMTSDPVLLASAVGVWLFPIYIVVELFFKGGSAGAKLMDEVDASKATMTLSEANKIIRWMSRWMRNQSEFFEGDNDDYQHQLANEVHGGLLMSGDVCWFAQYSSATDRSQVISRMIMNSVANTFETASENIAIGKFDEKWKCSDELERLMRENPFPEKDTPARRRRLIGGIEMG